MKQRRDGTFTGRNLKPGDRLHCVCEDDRGESDFNVHLVLSNSRTCLVLKKIPRRWFDEDFQTDHTLKRVLNYIYSARAGKQVDKLEAFYLDPLTLSAEIFYDLLLANLSKKKPVIETDLILSWLAQERQGSKLKFLRDKVAEELIWRRKRGDGDDVYIDRGRFLFRRIVRTYIRMALGVRATKVSGQ